MSGNKDIFEATLGLSVAGLSSLEVGLGRHHCQPNLDIAVVARVGLMQHRVLRGTCWLG